MKISCSSPSGIHGKIALTASKSISNRALIIRHLIDEPMILENLAEADDTKVLRDILEKLKASKFDDQIPTFNVGPAGTTMRFLAAFCALTPGVRVLTGSDRMKERPVGILVDGLRALGASIDYEEKEGYPPLRITGMPLDGGEVTMDGSVSSQFVSALLLIGPMLDGGLKINFDGEPVSKPYLNMTIGMMRYFGAEVGWKKGRLVVEDVPYRSNNLTIEADWSAASYWYEIIALSEGGKVELDGLFGDSLQGDAAIVEIYNKFGVKTLFGDNGVVLEKAAVDIKPIDLNLEDTPDIAQTIAATCAGLKTPCRLTGLKTLRIKETDRIVALENELKKFGVETRVGEDMFEIIDFGTPDKDITVSTYHDHRMAMSFAPLCMVYGSLSIENPGVVGKSYPGFWVDLEYAGFDFS